MNLWKIKYVLPLTFSFVFSTIMGSLEWNEACSCKSWTSCIYKASGPNLTGNSFDDWLEITAENADLSLQNTGGLDNP